MMYELKPCPFCGADESFLSTVKIGEERYMVMCSDCGGRGGSCETEDEAEEAWNQREEN